MAAHGHPALAFSWCGAPGAPADVIDVPLERACVAFDFLKNETGERPFCLLGFSRGAEQALLLASRIAKVNGVAVHAVTNRIQPGFSWRWEPYGSEPNQPKASAWTYGGTALKTGTRIRLDGFKGSLLLSHGIQDEVWPIEIAYDLHKTLVGDGVRVTTFYQQEKHVLTWQGRFNFLEELIRWSESLG